MVYIEEQNRIIRVKDLKIFENPSVKTISVLPNFNNPAVRERKLIFQVQQL